MKWQWLIAAPCIENWFKDGADCFAVSDRWLISPFCLPGMPFNIKRWFIRDLVIDTRLMDEDFPIVPLMLTKEKINHCTFFRILSFLFPVGNILPIWLAELHHAVPILHVRLDRDRRAVCTGLEEKRDQGDPTGRGLHWWDYWKWGVKEALRKQGERLMTHEMTGGYIPLHDTVNNFNAPFFFISPRCPFSSYLFCEA